MRQAALDRLSRSLTEVLELLGWLRENGVEIVSFREPVDQDSAMGRAMLHLAIVFAEMERDLPGERTLPVLERVRATGKHLGRRKDVSRKRAEETQNMRQRDGVSWGRIATITGSTSRSIRRICTWDLEGMAPTALEKDNRAAWPGRCRIKSVTGCGTARDWPNWRFVASVTPVRVRQRCLIQLVSVQIPLRQRVVH